MTLYWKATIAVACMGVFNLSAIYLGPLVYGPMP